MNEYVSPPSPSPLPGDGLSCIRTFKAVWDWFLRCLVLQDWTGMQVSCPVVFNACLEIRCEFTELIGG